MLISLYLSSKVYGQYVRSRIIMSVNHYDKNKSLEILMNTKFYLDMLHSWIHGVDNKDINDVNARLMNAYVDALNYINDNDLLYLYDDGTLASSIYRVWGAFDGLLDSLDLVDCDPQTKHFGKYRTLLNKLEVILKAIKVKSSLGMNRFQNLDYAKHPYNYELSKSEESVKNDQYGLPRKLQINQ